MPNATYSGTYEEGLVGHQDIIDRRRAEVPALEHVTRETLDALRDKIMAKLDRVEAAHKTARSDDTVPNVPRHASDELVLDTMRDALKRHEVDVTEVEIHARRSDSIVAVGYKVDRLPGLSFVNIHIDTYTTMRAKCDEAAAETREFIDTHHKVGPAGDFPLLGAPKS